MSYILPAPPDLEPHDRERNHYARDKFTLNAKPAVRLEGLYDVPWGTLGEAYGPAHFVPHYIEALSSPDEDDRDWGMEALVASCNHQGHPEEASPHVVPFLLRLLQEDATPDVGLVLWIASRMAIGDARWFCESGVELEAVHRTNCYDAVSAGAPIFAKLLTHRDPGVRCEAVAACAFIEACACQQQLLAMADDDAERGVRWMARIASGIAAQRGGSDITARARHWLAAGDGASERACALIALAYAARHHGGLSPQEMAELEKASFDDESPPLSARAEHLAWDIATTMRAQHTTLCIPESLAAKIALAQTRSDGVAVACAARAARALWPEPGDEPWLFEALSAELQALLTAVARDERMHANVLPYYNCPRQAPLGRHYLQRWVGLQRGPLDHVIDGWPIWRSMYALISGDMNDAIWLSAIESALSPEKRIALALDVSKNVAWFANLAALRTDDYRVRNTRVADIIVLLARMLACCEQGRRWAADHGTCDNAFVELLVVLTRGLAARDRGEWLSEADEQLVVVDHAPVSTYPRAIAEAVMMFAPGRLAQWLDKLELTAVGIQRQSSPTETVEARFIYFKPTWELLPMIACDAVTARIFAEIERYRAHRVAEAQHPERARFHGDDEPFPTAIALRACPGERTRQALRSTLDSIRLGE